MLAILEEAEEGPDRCQSHIAGLCRALPFIFKVFRTGRSVHGFAPAQEPFGQIGEFLLELLIAHRNFRTTLTLVEQAQDTGHRFRCQSEQSAGDVVVDVVHQFRQIEHG
jgi:hypothetical protein